MQGRRQTLLEPEDRGPDRQGAWVATLRLLLRVINFCLAVIGLAMMAYAVYLYASVKKESSLHSFPWFIFAFGAAGLFVLLTASTALVGVAHNSGFCLSLYSFLMVVLLIAQAALAIAFFADKSWQKLLPHDDTGEARKIARYLQHELSIVRWVGLAVLVVQILSVLLAYALSSAQQRLLEEASDEEDEVWGMRGARTASSAAPGEVGQAPPQRADPWSTRMRSKYGLDTRNFTYDPVRGQHSQQAPILPPPAVDGAGGRRCSIM